MHVFNWWVAPPRSGMRRLIAPWEYRHLRPWAGFRFACGIALVGLGAVTLSFGGNDWKTYGWTMVCAARTGLAGARRAGGLAGTARARRAGLQRQSPARVAPDAAPQAPP
jgi:hypothetical protein